MAFVFIKSVYSFGYLFFFQLLVPWILFFEWIYDDLNVKQVRGIVKKKNNLFFKYIKVGHVCKFEQYGQGRLHNF